MRLSRADIHRHIYTLALILVAVTLPLSRRFNSISILLLCANWLAEGHWADKLQKFRQHSRLILLFTALFFIYLVGMIYTSNYSVGWFEVQKKLSLAIMPIIIFTQVNSNKKNLQITLLAFAGACMLAIIYYLATVFVFRPDDLAWQLAHGRHTYREAIGNICDIHPTYISLYFVFSIFILLEFLFINKSISKWLLISSIIAMLCFVIMLAVFISRTEIMALFIILCGGVLIYSRQKRRLLPGIASIVLALIICIGLIWAIPTTRRRFLQIKETKFAPPKGIHYNSTNLRIGIFDCTRSVLEKHWLAGVGTGDVQDHLNHCYQSKGYSPAMYERNYNAHNQYFQTWLSVGVPGLVILLACLIVPFRLSFKGQNYLYFAFLALFAIACLTESMLCTQRGIVFYALFNALFACYLDREKINVNL